MVNALLTTMFGGLSISAYFLAFYTWSYSHGDRLGIMDVLNGSLTNPNTPWFHYVFLYGTLATVPLTMFIMGLIGIFHKKFKRLPPEVIALIQSNNELSQEIRELVKEIRNDRATRNPSV